MIYVWRKLSRKNHAFIKVIVFVNHDDMTCLKKLKYLCNFNPSYLVIVGQLFILIIVSQQVKWKYIVLKWEKSYFHIKISFDSNISNYIFLKLNLSRTASITAFVALSINQCFQVCKLLLQISPCDEKNITFDSKSNKCWQNK